MNEPRITPLPYFPDSARLFEAIADEPWAIFLDSGPASNRQGRYDILSCRPYATLATHGPETRVTTRAGSTVSGADPFTLLRHHLPRHSGTRGPLPFYGGAIGYFGYDLGRRVEALPSLAEDAEHIADMAVGLYDWAVVVDHAAQASFLVGYGDDPATFTDWDRWVARFSTPAPPQPRPPLRVTSDVVSNMSPERYADAFARIKRYILDGDCYQVNLAQRFSAEATGSGWEAYQRLRHYNAAPFAAYLRTDEAEILSSSPERLLEVRGRIVETKPIKGTRRRHPDPDQDEAAARELAASSKDQAENLMIVDLLRNDLSKSCQTGSVKVPVLFGIESYTNVHHMVSTVSGRLREDADAPALLRGCFPGGSITGAPKLRAMEIIEELEPHRRGVYCGAIGYLDANGDMDTNISIRTIVYSHGRIRCWAGGGIVFDSKVEDEYQETLVKAKAMLDLLQDARS